MLQTASGAEAMTSDGYSAEIKRLSDELAAALVENALLRASLEMIMTSAGAVMNRIDALDREAGRAGRPYEAAITAPPGTQPAEHRICGMGRCAVGPSEEFIDEP